VALANFTRLYGKAHTWFSRMVRGRKSGYAPVGMTNSLHPKG
jgi:hypothetical protein